MNESNTKSNASTENEQLTGSTMCTPTDEPSKATPAAVSEKPSTGSDQTSGSTRPTTSDESNKAIPPSADSKAGSVAMSRAGSKVDSKASPAADSKAGSKADSKATPAAHSKASPPPVANSKPQSNTTTTAASGQSSTTTTTTTPAQSSATATSTTSTAKPPPLSYSSVLSRRAPLIHSAPLKTDDWPVLGSKPTPEKPKLELKLSPIKPKRSSTAPAGASKSGTATPQASSPLTAEPKTSLLKPQVDSSEETKALTGAQMASPTNTSDVPSDKPKEATAQAQAGSAVAADSSTEPSKVSPASHPISSSASADGPSDEPTESTTTPQASPATTADTTMDESTAASATAQTSSTVTGDAATEVPATATATPAADDTAGLTKSTATVESAAISTGPADESSTHSTQPANESITVKESPTSSTDKPAPLPAATPLADSSAVTATPPPVDSTVSTQQATEGPTALHKAAPTEHSTADSDDTATPVARPSVSEATPVDKSSTAEARPVRKPKASPPQRTGITVPILPVFTVESTISPVDPVVEPSTPAATPIVDSTVSELESTDDSTTLKSDIRKDESNTDLISDKPNARAAVTLPNLTDQSTVSADTPFAHSAVSTVDSTTDSSGLKGETQPGDPIPELANLTVTPAADSTKTRVDLAEESTVPAATPTVELTAATDEDSSALKTIFDSAAKTSMPTDAPSTDSAGKKTTLEHGLVVDFDTATITEYNMGVPITQARYDSLADLAALTPVPPSRSSSPDTELDDDSSAPAEVPRRVKLSEWAANIVASRDDLRDCTTSPPDDSDGETDVKRSGPHGSPPDYAAGNPEDDSPGDVSGDSSSGWGANSSALASIPPAYCTVIEPRAAAPPRRPQTHFTFYPMSAAASQEERGRGQMYIWPIPEDVVFWGTRQRIEATLRSLYDRMICERIFNDMPQQNVRLDAAMEMDLERKIIRYRVLELYRRQGHGHRSVLPYVLQFFTKRELAVLIDMEPIGRAFTEENIEFVRDRFEIICSCQVDEATEDRINPGKALPRWWFRYDECWDEAEEEEPPASTPALAQAPVPTPPPSPPRARRRKAKKRTMYLLTWETYDETEVNINVISA